ncbi:hypothetical protein Pryu01_02503 [Paraliobacillus ryukyuensis]|uniref:ABC-2 type transport system permease protein n=1 Tax=Paraliobacillus ryukyuensis TaxID=200904 RepID=A0A366DTU3_9BACI|nr:hypothetical protein [Paraliobacillus ryukyuensis]RBO93510.1 hypothetical protein DES48_11118 [Paraliobacillus ryukyuensis]
MNNHFALKILDRLASLFRLFKVDYATMRAILASKLTMDQRRVPTIFQDTKQKDGNHAFYKSLLLYAFYGLILIPFLIIGDNYLYQMSIVFGITMFILMTSMVADFSSVLLDVRDKAILHTKPIEQKTISAAKMMHVIIYMTHLTVAFILIPFIVAIAVKGIVFSLLFMLEIVFITLFIIVLTALIYIAILRFFDGERLKDIINYVQIFLSVAILVGYQIVVRSFEFVDLEISFGWHWWHLFIPPMWFAAPFELLLQGNQASYIILFSVIAVLVPTLSFILYLKLIPSFEQNLQKMMQSSGPMKVRKHRLQQWIGKIICRSAEERAIFHFSSKLISNEREFKLKVYPSLGFSIVMPFIILFNIIQTDLNAPYAFLTIYFASLMTPNVVHMLKFSDKYRGSWIYKALPLADPSLLYKATLKAFITKLYLPIILVLSVIFLILFGDFSILPDIIAMILVGLMYVVISYRMINNEVYPFSQSFSFSQNTNTAITFLTMFIIGAFAGIHFLISKIPFGIYGYLLVLLIVNWLTWRTVFKNRSQGKERIDEN